MEGEKGARPAMAPHSPTPRDAMWPMCLHAMEVMALPHLRLQQGCHRLQCVKRQAMQPQDPLNTKQYV